jgi:hypothetical protein
MAVDTVRDAVHTTGPREWCALVDPDRLRVTGTQNDVNVRVSAVTAASGDVLVARYIEGSNRGESFLLPECIDDYVDESNPVRVIDAFVDKLELASLGFEKAIPAETGRPAYHPVILLRLYTCGYLNRIPLVGVLSAKRGEMSS